MKRILAMLTTAALLLFGSATAEHLERTLADLREDLTAEEIDWLAWALQLERLDTATLVERYYDGEVGFWAEVSAKVAIVLAYSEGDPEPEVHLEAPMRVVCWPVGDYWKVLQTGDEITVRAWVTEDFGIKLEDCLLAAPPVALLQYDDNRNGQITCAEAREHGIAPVTSEHPAYQFMRDGDGDGVVCE